MRCASAWTIEKQDVERNRLEAPQASCNPMLFPSFDRRAEREKADLSRCMSDGVQGRVKRRNATCKRRSGSGGASSSDAQARPAVAVVSSQATVVSS